MTMDDFDSGRLIIEVGLAPPNPAELVGIRITREVGSA